MNYNTFTSGILLGLLLVGGVALAQFTEPTAGPYTSGTNAVEPLNTSAVQQEKIGGIGLGAKKFTANQYCLNGSCVTSWPGGGLSATTCHLETRQINGHRQTQLSGDCNDKLSVAARAEGWFATGKDTCHTLSGANCTDQASCHYTRLVCSGGVTVDQSTNASYTTLPLTVAGDGFTFARRPQCNDGVNNDGASGVDYPADPQCQGFWDDSEAVF